MQQDDAIAARIEAFDHANGGDVGDMGGIIMPRDHALEYKASDAVFWTRT